jgi:hypothetical protein
MHRNHLVATGVFVASLILSAQAAALPIGVDNFEDGTTQGWVVNLLGLGSHPAPPTNNADGGPLGPGDNYLLVTALGGGGTGSRLTVLNASQWAGNYLTGTPIDIVMDARNLGSTDLHLRLEFEDPTVGPPTNIAFSTNPIVLPAGGGWTPITFTIVPANFTAGLGSVDDALANTTILRIYHSVAANFPNPVTPIDPVLAQLGLDNIGIVIEAVPEPATALLLLIGAAAAAVRYRRTDG